MSNILPFNPPETSDNHQPTSEVPETIHPQLQLKEHGHKHVSEKSLDRKNIFPPGFQVRTAVPPILTPQDKEGILYLAKHFAQLARLQDSDPQ